MHLGSNPRWQAAGRSQGLHSSGALGCPSQVRGHAAAAGGLGSGAAVRLAELGCGRAMGRPKGLVGGAGPGCGDRCGQCQAPAVPRAATSLWGDLGVSEVAFLKTFSL